jgi:hypothetical protein
MKFLHSVVVQDQAIAADGIYTFDLGVNPLSALLISLRPLNNTGTLSNFASYLAICQAINRATVYKTGEAVVNMRGEDIAAMNYFRHGIVPYQGMHLDTDDFRRCTVLPMLFGKYPYDGKSCLPSVPRGQLSLELDLDIADTGYDGLRLSVEMIELLGVTPKEYERRVQVVQTFAATGQQDVELSPGNLVRGILLYGTTPFTGATPAPSWGRVRTLLDNQEAGYSASDFEVAQMLHTLWGRQPPAYDGHIHRTTTDGNAQTLVPTLGYASSVGLGWNNYAFLDFDPSRDDSLALDARKASRLQLRADAETADLVRAIPIEVVPV